MGTTGPRGLSCDGTDASARPGLRAAARFEYPGSALDRNDVHNVVVQFGHPFVEGGQAAMAYPGELGKVGVGHLPMADDAGRWHI